jgi:hypothetical protein
MLPIIYITYMQGKIVVTFFKKLTYLYNLT